MLALTVSLGVEDLFLIEAPLLKLSVLLSEFCGSVAVRLLSELGDLALVCGVFVQLAIVVVVPKVAINELEVVVLFSVCVVVVVVVLMLIVFLSVVVTSGSEDFVAELAGKVLLLETVALVANADGADGRSVIR